MIPTNEISAQLKERELPKKISVQTGNFRFPLPDNTLCQVPAEKVFERVPAHPLEQRWALYVNLRRLEKAVLSRGQLPKVGLDLYEMHWISRRGTIEWEEPCNEEVYLFCFVPKVSVGGESFNPWGVQTACDASYKSSLFYLEFFHRAPAPILPWPGVRVRALEMPSDLIESVADGLRQAEEALLTAIGLRNPAVTAIMA